MRAYLKRLRDRVSARLEAEIRAQIRRQVVKAKADWLRDFATLESDLERMHHHGDSLCLLPHDDES